MILNHKFFCRTSNEYLDIELLVMCIMSTKDPKSVQFKRKKEN